MTVQQYVVHTVNNTDSSGNTDCLIDPVYLALALQFCQQVCFKLQNEKKKKKKLSSIDTNIISDYIGGEVLDPVTRCTEYI